MTTRRAWIRGLASLAACALIMAGCGHASRPAPSSAPTGTSTGPDSPRARPAARRAPVPDGDWSTFDYDAARTGVGPLRTGITSANVHHLALRIVHLNGTVDSAPIQLHGLYVRGRRRDVVFMTTSYGRTVAVDPGTGATLWEFTPADIGGYQGSSQVTTATPVADPNRRYLYAASPDGVIHKLSTTTGREVRAFGWPARVTFDPTREKIAGALNLSGSSVIVVVGGYYGDAPTYQGHAVLLDRYSGRVTHVFNALCSNRRSIIDPPTSCPQSDSAIWARAGAVVEPRSGRLLVATGNGDFNGRTDWGDSVLELSPTLALLHNWTPVDQQALNESDGDLGSSEPALAFTGGRRLAVQGAKDDRLHLLDLDRLNGTTGGAGPRLGGELEDLPSPGSAEVLTAPAVASLRGRTYLFVADDGGTAAYVVHGGPRPGLSLAWEHGSAGTSPVLAGGLLYVFDELGGAVDVYGPVSGRRIATLPAASGHWNSPIVIGGRIILPVGNYHDQSTRGELYIWHLG